MKGKNENKIDQLFKDGLSGSEDHIAFREEDWASMERLLDNKPSKKAVIMRRIYYSTAIAAILLLAVGLFFFNRDDKANSNKNQLSNKVNKEQLTPAQKDGEQNIQRSQDSVQQNNIVTAESLAKNSTTNQTGKSGTFPGQTLNSASKNYLKPGTIRDTHPVNPDQQQSSNKTNNAGQDKVPVMNDGNNIADPSKIASVNSQTQNNLANNNTPSIADTAAAVVIAPVQTSKKDKQAIKPILKTGPRFTLSILAAPDLNAVNSFNRNQVGTNFGVQLGLRISKRFSVSTGAAYAVKPYQSDASLYKSPSWQGRNPDDLPSYVAANCRVLDIPLNLSYQFYSKGRNSFAIGSGLSSYIMLRENYHFSFADGSDKLPYDVQIDNKNQHWLGVLNLNATYERKINSRFSTVIQPYMKLPLTGIGNGRVDLRSTGVAVGVNWNMSSVFKPR